MVHSHNISVYGHEIKAFGIFVTISTGRLGTEWIDFPQVMVVRHAAVMFNQVSSF